MASENSITLKYGYKGFYLTYAVTIIIGILLRTIGFGEWIWYGLAFVILAEIRFHLMVVGDLFVDQDGIQVKTILRTYGMRWDEIYEICYDAGPNWYIAYGKGRRLIIPHDLKMNMMDRVQDSQDHNLLQQLNVDIYRANLFILNQCKEYGISVSEFTKHYASYAGHKKTRV